MISKFWWLNFLLAVATVLLIVGTVMIWQNELIIPPASKATAPDQWPNPSHVDRNRPDLKSYEPVSQKNLFNENRRERDPVSLTDAEKVKPALPKPVPKPAPEPVPRPKPISEIQILDKKELEVFGVVIGDNLKYALVRDPDDSNEKKQIRVMEKTSIGRFTVEKILPELIVVSDKETSYKVPVFEKKEPDENGSSKKTARNLMPVVPSEKANIISTNDSQTENPNKKIEKEEDEWVILDTPFGKKRIKKRK